MKLRKNMCVITLILSILPCSYVNGSVQDRTETESYEKGYDLPVADTIREEAEADCKAVMEQVRDIYKKAGKGNSLNPVISEQTMLEMKAVIRESGNPVISSEHYASMEHYGQMEKFIEDAQKGNSGSVTLYEIRMDGGITREEFTCDGTEMYVLAVRAAWNDTDNSMITSVSCARLKKWNYTERGWFCCELCVPEPPEVAESVDGSYLLRVRPLPREYVELSKKYVLPLGYQGNNLLCSDWSAKKMDGLDYNGMYEYLYRMKYGNKFDSQSAPDGIAAEEFEGVIMEYLPVTAEQLRKWAVFDEESQTYAWTRLGCGNYAPTFFDTSVPEVADRRNNEDGTVTFIVHAVCDSGVCNDAVITHEVTVQFQEDGSFQYLENKILNHGLENVPDYQYRCK